MSRRKKTSGGQAIVMVTLALFSMVGMMGLAVDLGWSFFIKKQAQAAADGAAMAAVHEGWQRLGGSVAGVSCPGTAGTLYCFPGSPPESCSAISDTASNLYNGCRYAITNGFDYVNDSRSDVTVQADIGSNSLPTTPTGAALNITHMAYWVTVRTVRTIPQLFSAIAGNTQSTVAAIATAAIVQQTIPGSFYGMNQAGDCRAQGSGALTTGALVDCGVDANVKGNGSVCPGSAAGDPASVLCGPDGIFFASTCNHGAVSHAGCADPGSTTENYAAYAQNSNTYVWSRTQIQLAGDGIVNNTAQFKPSTANGSMSTGDPFEGKPQPPIISQPGSCEVTNGTINGSNDVNSPLQLAPYQYYSKTGSGVTAVYGGQITITGYVKFVSTGGTCPSGITTGSVGSGLFPTYVMYGGVNIQGNNTAVDFTDGQYVFTGPSGPTGDTIVAGIGNPSITCSTCSGGTSTGVMMISTDDTYTGTLTKPPALSGTTFYQGDVNLKNITTTSLAGVNENNLPSTASTLTDFNHILFWQDRRNSTDTYDALGHVTTSSTTAVPPASNHVTASSPALILDHGNLSGTLKGVFHQPRGAWLDLTSGTVAIANSPLQIYTGMIYCDPCGNSAVTLLPTAAPVTVYRTSLIQ